MDRISFPSLSNNAVKSDLDLENLIAPGLTIVNRNGNNSIQNGPANNQRIAISDEQARLEEAHKNPRRLELMFKLDRERKALIKELETDSNDGLIKIDCYIKLFEETVIALKQLRPTVRIN